MSGLAHHQCASKALAKVSQTVAVSDYWSPGVPVAVRPLPPWPAAVQAAGAHGK